MKILTYWFFISAYLTIGQNAYAQENTSQCKGTSVVVNYDNIEDFKLVCNSVNDVIKVAKKIGLSEELRVAVSIIDKLSNGHTGTALALFKPSTMEVQVLSSEACRKSFKDEVIFAQKIDHELFRSMVIHELAHVLAWQNMKTRSINRKWHEYFAYVIQFVLLDNIHREKIITSSNVEAFSDNSEITVMYYFLNPHKFAVKSYLHFTKLKDGWTHLLSILEK